MLKKIFSLITALLILSSCGYTPMFSKNFENDYIIKIKDFKGDNDLNNFIRQKINRVIDNDKNDVKIFEISFVTSYSKEIQTKDKSSKVKQYSLIANANFTIEKNGTVEKVVFNEKSIMSKLSDDFEESNYEKSFKDNVSQIFVNKLTMFLSRIK